MRAARTVVPSGPVLLHGFYGAGNVGDEAILGASLDLLRDGGYDATVVAEDAEAVASAWGVRALSRQAGRAERGGALVRARAYLLGGGGLLKDYGEGSGNVARWLHWLNWSAQAGVPTMLWSVGVENVVRPESERMIREALARVDVVTTRDEASAERLRALGVDRPIAVTADPVPYGVRRWRRDAAPDPERPLVAVSLRHWYARGSETVDDVAFGRMLGELATALDRLVAERSARVVLVPFRAAPYDDDRAVLSDLAGRMSAEAALDESGLQGVRATAALLSRASLVVGMRLHAAVIATTLGVPTLAIGYMPKVADYMAEIGQAERVRAVEAIEAGWLHAEAGRALDDIAAERADLLRATDVLAGRFETNLALLQSVAP